MAKNLIAEYRMLSTANVSDGLDRLDIKGAPHGIGPLWDGCAKIVGPAANPEARPADPVQAHQRVRYDMMTKAGYKP